MKKIMPLVFGMFFVLCALAEQALPLTPKTCKDITQVTDIWINAKASTKCNVGSNNCADSFSKRIVRILSKKPDKKEFLINYEFEVKDTGKYKFYAALICQGTSYASPVEYRFDKADWQKIIPVKGKRIRWGLSSAINWESLGLRELSAGTHNLELRFNKKARNGNWSFMCDGIIGIMQGKKKE